MKVYLDSAASTQIHPDVVSEMTKCLLDGTGNPSSLHASGRLSKGAIEKARKTIAHGLGASPLEIVFTSCGTESNNMAIKSSVTHYNVKHIISSPLEHKCVKETIQSITKDISIRLHYLNVDSKGHVDIIQLESLLKSLNGKVLVSLMHANNELGVLLDIKKVGDLCKRYDALYHTDTVQTIGHMPINLKELNIDYCSGSAHKFHGPKGTGFLYMKSTSKLPPFIHGGGQERSFRSGTENVAGIVGMATAFEISLRDMDKDNQHIDDLRAYTKEVLLREIPDVRFNGGQENCLNRVLSICLPEQYKTDTLLFQLDLAGVAVSGGSACSSGASAGSYVLDAIGHPLDRKTIRVSFSIFTTKEEIDYAVEQLVKVAAKVLS